MPNFFESPDQTPTEDQVPSWLLAADNHNLGNTRGGSWLSPDTWGDKFESAGKLIATGALSGVNSFYNTGMTVGNWFGAENEMRDTKDWISEIDSDLGQYYDENRTAADLVGFIAGSLIPGIAGVKVLNAGQTAIKAAQTSGLIGGNLAKATGLLVPNTQKYITLAAQDIIQSSATFSAINQAGIKALASGVWQNTLEGIAFEVAVQATMFKSPILEQQDGWDIAKNIAVGGAVSGVIGGAFTGASTFGAIKRLVTKEDLALKPFSSRATVAESTAPSEKIILMVEDKDLGAVPLPGSENYDIAIKQYNDRVRRIDNEVRTETHKMVPGSDSELGNMVADSIYKQDHTTVLNNLLHVEEITRVGQTSKIEAEINRLAKAGQKDETLQVGYVKLTGEGAGQVVDTAPPIINLADRVKVPKGSTTEAAVLDEVRGYKFKSDSNWSVMKLSGSTGHFEAEARYIWADKILKEVKEGTTVNQFDLPILERAYRDGVINIKVTDDAGHVLKDSFGSREELWRHIVETKNQAANDLVRKQVFEGSIPVEQGTAAVAKITNTKLGRLEGSQLGDDFSDYQAWQSSQKEYGEFLASKELKTPANETADPRFLPTYAKVSRQIRGMEDLDGNVIDGMTWIKQNQKLLQEGVDRSVAKATGELYGQLPEISDSLLLNSNRYGSGAGLASFSNGGYGSLEATMQQVGSVTQRLKQQYRQATADLFDGPLVALGNNQEAAIEFSTINQRITRSAKQWVRHTEGNGDELSEYLITKDAAAKYIDQESGAVDFDSLFAEMGEDLIELKNAQTIAFVDNYIARTGQRTNTYRELNAAMGKENVKDAAVFRPIRPNPTDYPYFAFVKDPSVTGQGHTTMIFANSEGKLQELINRVPDKYQVVTKRDSEDFFRSRNEYEYQRTLHENYIDTDLKNRGVMSEFFTKSNPQKIVDDILQQNLREDDVLAMEVIRSKYHRQFDWLEDQGSAYTKISASKFGTYSDKLEKAGKNPYLDYIKTALDISKMSERPLLYSFNKFLDTAVSRAVGQVSDTWGQWKNPLDSTKINEINSLLDKYGMNTGWRDAATDLLVNHSAPKGELTKFIRGANAVLAKLTLGLDPLNALNNAIGANVLRATELKQLTDAIKSGDSNLAGKLAQLSKIQLPGTGDLVTSPPKLMAAAIKNFFSDDHKNPAGLFQRYKSMGLIKDANMQFRDILDDFTLKGTETVGELNSRLSRAFEKAKNITDTGEKLTGNKFAEEFNRFISADVVRQLTDLAVESKLLTKAEQAAYMNTFVNRVEGITIASQRPLMFQGPVGQAVGLFQSYQFNLIQQMFRYVGEGTKKDAALLLGLQGTFYGMQGLPAFQFMNQHIVGTLSGNKEHRDLYDMTYGTLGPTLGDFVLYGIPSNLSQANIYSRGDINPRHVTIIPTSIPDIPIVGAYGKFLSSVKGTVDKIATGGNVWESLLQGIEHNGLNRPLAGLAQVLQSTSGNGTVYSTTSKGNILFSNDLMSWASAVRLAGGRPLDEAIINDGVFRIQAYQQYDKARMDKLSQAVKTTTIEGETAGDVQLEKFAEKYAELGGKQAQFNKYMMNQFKTANKSQSEKIVSQLQNPFSQKMQLLMGGSDPMESLASLAQPAN